MSPFDTEEYDESLTIAYPVKVIKLAERILAGKEQAWLVTRQDVVEWVLLYPFSVAYLRSALPAIGLENPKRHATAFGWAMEALLMWAADLHEAGRIV